MNDNDRLMSDHDRLTSDNDRLMTTKRLERLDPLQHLVRKVDALVAPLHQRFVVCLEPPLKEALQRQREDDRTDADERL